MARKPLNMQTVRGRGWGLKAGRFWGSMKIRDLFLCVGYGDKKEPSP